MDSGQKSLLKIDSIEASVYSIERCKRIRAREVESLMSLFSFDGVECFELRYVLSISNQTEEFTSLK